MLGPVWPLVLLLELPIPLEPLPELGLRKLVLSAKRKRNVNVRTMERSPCELMRRELKVNGKKCREGKKTY